MLSDYQQLQGRLIESILATIPDCKAVYRFGSWGTGHELPKSDIDLGILVFPPLKPLKRWELEQQLALIAERDVDLVDLFRVSTVMKMQIVGRGERIYCNGNDEIDVEFFENTVFSSYARLNEERRSILEDVKNRGCVYGE